MASDAVWYYANGSQQVGPMALDELCRQLAGNPQALVYGPGLANWAPAGQVPAVAARLRMPAAVAPPGPPPTTRKADVIDYELFGEEMQYAVVTLDPDEMAIAEPGAMMYMTAGIKMETRFGDPSQGQQGFWSKVATAGKRMLTGESLFMTTFSNIAAGREQVAFAAPYPGKILPMNLAEMGGEIICQKDSFLCAARGVQISIAFQKKILTGLFGGEGFIMQRLTGDGIALVHAGGTLAKRTLKAGESLRVDTGCLVALAPSINYDVQFIGGFKNMIFGGEGIFFATVTGPGDVWLQSLPFSRLAGRILANAPSAGKSGKGEGSILGGIGNLLDGDNR